MTRATFDIGLNAVIAAVTEEEPRVLLVRSPGSGSEKEPHPGPALPVGLLDPLKDRTLELALRRRVREQTGLALGYVEQLYTFGDRDRDPGVIEEGLRALSVAYLALVREAVPSGEREAGWLGIYDFFPWEDWRGGRPSVLDRRLLPALEGWVDAAPVGNARGERRERADITFGLGGVAWNGERVLERYELLYEAGLVSEAVRDRGTAPVDGSGRSMALDHRRILATALGRLRGKLRYRPVVFELLSETFTLLRLQRVVEALAGVRLHKQNFRRLVETAGLVEGTGELDTQTGGRPAERFRFRREVLRERPAPGVGLPASR
ncbi:MAG: NUDIX domain-containing protein [Acidobacteriota bacterium]